MKHLIIQFMAITLGCIALSSCSSIEDVTMQNPYISSLEDTGCLSHWDTDNAESRSDVNKGLFEMLFEEQVAKCKFTSLDYPCDYEQVNVKIAYNEGVMTIIEYPNSDKADCRCEIDASFTIKNMPQNDFILKIYHGDTESNYDVDNPRYVGYVNISNNKISFQY